MILDTEPEEADDQELVKKRVNTINIGQPERKMLHIPLDIQDSFISQSTIKKDTILNKRTHSNRSNESIENMKDITTKKESASPSRIQNKTT